MNVRKFLIVVPSFSFSLILNPLPALAVSCGETVNLNGKVVKLEANLLCNTTPALTVVGPGTFDMTGHTLSCLIVDSNNGLEIDGAKAKIKNGVVSGCRTGVRIVQTGRHTIENMVAENNSRTGFDVFLGHNIYL